MRSILYLHGFASGPNSAKVRALRALLAPDGIELNAPDLNAPSFEKLDFEANVRRATDAGRAIPPSAIVGSSLGALIALEVVRRGTRRGHTYHLLASDRGPKRLFEPFLVTLTSKSEIFPEFDHPGIEFIHILEGSLRYRHGPESYLLKPGDSLTFRGDVPHGPDRLLKLPVRMLSIIIYGGESS